MKHLLKILFLVPLCVACSSDDIGEEDVRPEQSPYTIGFNAEVERTRAMATSTDLEDNGFSVWGGYKGATASGIVFDGRKVTYQDSYWTYDNLEYWTYNTYHFHGIYPSPVTGSYTVEWNNENSQLEVKGFDSTSEKDLLHAKARGIDGAMPPSTVNLSFEHTLSNVNVQLKKHIKNQNDVVTVTGVYLLGMCTKGDYTWKEDNSTTPSTITANWTVDNQSASYTGQTFTKDLTVNYEDFLTNQLLIPQHIDPETHPVALLVTYDFKLTGDGSTLIKDNQLVVPLPTPTPETVWGINKKITYQAIIHANTDITFATPIVEDWGEEQAGGTIIIK